MENALEAKQNATMDNEIKVKPQKKESYVNNEWMAYWHKLKSFFHKIQNNLVLLTIISIFTSSLLVVLLWSTSSEYRPLYSVKAKYDPSEVLNILDIEGIDYSLRNHDGAILVREERVAKIRMMLAAKGIKEKLPTGFESLEENSGFGQSQFIERAKFNYALEGELARSISTFDQVISARVHLAIPERSLFVAAEEEQPRASVVVELLNGTDLKSEQVDAVINLVSGSVIGLKPENVQLVDHFGRLLSNKSSSADLTLSSSKQLDFKESLEQELIFQARDMLTPILGVSNYRIQVSSDIDFSKRNETVENYFEPVVEKENILYDSNSSSLALGIPGSLSNTPPLTDAEAQEEDEKQNLRQETNRDYALGGKVSYVEYQQGIVERLSVSVVLNDDSHPLGKWTDEELDYIENMVKSAVGFSQERGDFLNITSFPFIKVDIAQSGSTSTLAWYESANIIQPLKYIVALIICFLMIIFILRPLIHHLTVKEQFDGELISEEEIKEKKLKQKMHSLGISQEEFIFDDNLPSSDSPLEVQVQHLKLISKEDPERVAEILREWMQKSVV